MKKRQRNIIVCGFCLCGACLTSIEDDGNKEKALSILFFHQTVFEMIESTVILVFIVAHRRKVIDLLQGEISKHCVQVH